jgi:hypothetical protein
MRRSDDGRNEGQIKSFLRFNVPIGRCFFEKEPWKPAIL